MGYSVLKKAYEILDRIDEDEVEVSFAFLSTLLINVVKKKNSCSQNSQFGLQFVSPE